MKLFLLLGAALTAVVLTTPAVSQTASGNSATSCSQSGTTLTCITTTSITLPSGTNLTGMSLPQSISGGPSCTSLSASPNVIPSGVATQVNLSLIGCPAAAAYKYTWASPVTGTNASTATYAATLNQNTPSSTLSVDVCFASNPTSCSTYLVTLNVQAPTPQLLGCRVTPNTTSIEQATSAPLVAKCDAGDGAGSGVTYQWARNGAPISGAQSSTYSLSTSSDTGSIGSYTYSVQITNAAPSNLSASATLIVTAPPVRVADYCPATPVRYTFNASELYNKIYSPDLAPNFGDGDDFIVAIDVSASDSTVGRYLAGISFSDYGSNRGGRYGTISQSKCDYSENARWVTGNFLGVKTPANATFGSIALGADNRSATARLTPGRWYFNVRNVPGFCASGQSCHIVMQWSN